MQNKQLKNNSYANLKLNPLEKYRNADFGISIDKARKQDAIEFWHKYNKEFTARPCPSCTAIETVKLENFANYYPLVKCNNCTLVYIPIEFTANQLQDYYENATSIKMLNDFYATRKKQTNLVYSHRLAQVSAYLPQNNKVIRVLEIGCGNGDFLYQLKQANPEKSFELYGIEPNAESCAAATNREIKVYQGLADHTDSANLFTPEFYDLVLCFEIIEHLVYPSILFKNIYKSLLKDGKLLLTTPNIEGMACIIANYNNNFPFSHAIAPPMHIQGFSRVSLAVIAQNLGYKINKIEAKGKFDQPDFIKMAEMNSLSTDANSYFKNIYQINANWDSLSSGMQALINDLNASSTITAVLTKP